jgi:hypothetical protein
MVCIAHRRRLEGNPISVTASAREALVNHRSGLLQAPSSEKFRLHHLVWLMEWAPMGRRVLTSVVLLRARHEEVSALLVASEMRDGTIEGEAHHGWVIGIRGLLLEGDRLGKRAHPSYSPFTICLRWESIVI